jgi:phosphotransferase system enzyme I (PtsI)
METTGIFSLSGKAGTPDDAQEEETADEEKGKECTAACLTARPPVELPAAVEIIDELAAAADFLCIGTNDLIQYTLAIDRTDGSVAHLYDPMHPAVLKLISQTIQSAQRVGMPVAVCGEMAGDPKLTRLLIGMGLREFSMHPAQLLEVKQQVMMADSAQLALRVAKILKLDEPDKIAEQMEKL